jgi:hypothetical protein
MARDGPASETLHKRLDAFSSELWP